MGKLKDQMIVADEINNSLDIALKYLESEFERTSKLDKESLVAEILKLQRENKSLKQQLKISD
jgi:cell shape-determining protein MreC